MTDRQSKLQAMHGDEAAEGLASAVIAGGLAASCADSPADA